MRKILILGGGVVAAVVLLGGLYRILPLHADPSGTTSGSVGLVQTAQAATPPAELQVTPADHVMGKDDAPVTIVEYASMTCGHCAAFHVVTLPDLKKKYVDTGKVRFVYRDFPLDKYALQAAQIAECAGNDRYFGVVDLVFQTQPQWTAGKDPIAELTKSLRIAGIGEADVKACLANDKIADAVATERQVAAEKLGVNSTPTLFINGERYTGARTIEAFDEALGKLLK
jgi:protein-disulfide isomerase